MKTQLISFNCILKDRFGKILGRSSFQDVLTANQDESPQLKVLTEALSEMQQGEHRKLFVPAKEAYGFYDPDLVITRQLSELDGAEGIQVGEMIKYVQKGKEANYRVVEVTSHSVKMDANHPLAGQDLIFEIECMKSQHANIDQIAKEEISSSLSLH